MKFIYLIPIIIIGCKSVSSTVSPPAIPSLEQSVLREIDRSITSNSIMIKVQNTSEEPIDILSPMEKNIEVWLEGGWKKVNVLYCDCGGPPCPAPPETRSVEPKGSFVFSWDRNVEKCLSTDSGSVTEKKKVSSGLYRAVYYFKLSDETTEKIELTFNLN